MDNSPTNGSVKTPSHFSEALLIRLLAGGSLAFALGAGVWAICIETGLSLGVLLAVIPLLVYGILLLVKADKTSNPLVFGFTVGGALGMIALLGVLMAAAALGVVLALGLASAFANSSASSGAVLSSSFSNSVSSSTSSNNSALDQFLGNLFLSSFVLMLAIILRGVFVGINAWKEKKLPWSLYITSFLVLVAIVFYLVLFPFRPFILYFLSLCCLYAADDVIVLRHAPRKTSPYEEDALWDKIEPKQ